MPRGRPRKVIAPIIPNGTEALEQTPAFVVRLFGMGEDGNYAMEIIDCLDTVLAKAQAKTFETVWRMAEAVLALENFAGVSDD